MFQIIILLGFIDELLSTLIKDNSLNGKNAHANMVGTFYNSSKNFNANFDRFFCSNNMAHSNLVTMG